MTSICDTEAGTRNGTPEDWNGYVHHVDDTPDRGRGGGMPGPADLGGMTGRLQSGLFRSDAGCSRGRVAVRHPRRHPDRLDLPGGCGARIPCAAGPRRQWHAEDVRHTAPARGEPGRRAAPDVRGRRAAARRSGPAQPRVPGVCPAAARRRQGVGGPGTGPGRSARGAGDVPPEDLRLRGGPCASRFCVPTRALPVATLGISPTSGASRSPVRSRRAVRGRSTRPPAVGASSCAGPPRATSRTRRGAPGRSSRPWHGAPVAGR